MRFQHCIFDLYGTLVDIHTEERLPALWREMSVWYNKHGARYTPKALEAAYFRTARQMEHHAARLLPDTQDIYPEIKIEEVFQQLYKHKDVNASLELAIRTGEKFREASLDYIRLYDGAVELLQALRAGGQGVWLLSNAQRIFTAPELHSLGLDGLFDGVYLSSDWGCRKPDRRFYEQLLQERGIAPESAVMVGNDGMCDIQGARAVGMATVYIRSNLSPKEPLPPADFVLEEMDLRRVQDILMNLS